MGYGHAENLARGGAQRGGAQRGEHPAAERLAEAEPTTADQPGILAPDWYASPDLVSVLTGHDVGALFCWVNDAGMPQRRLAVLTGSSQSQVADIMSGRRARVQVYEVLVRIAEGLGLPRERMGLSFWGPDGRWYGPADTYPGGVRVAELEGAAEMLRRQFEHLLALGAAAAFGGLVPGVGELAPDLSMPALARDLPSRIGMVDVEVLRGYREHLRTMARTYGGQARAAVGLTEWAQHWLGVDASDTVRRAVQRALAELHTTTAWCCHDGGAPARALHHNGRAVELATDAGDAFQAASALLNAGMMLVDRDRPNDALKAIQLAGLRLLDASHDDPRVPILVARCHAESACALAMLDDSQSVLVQARDELAKARDGWVAPNAFAAAGMHLTSALTWLHSRQLDAAETAATRAVSAFGSLRRDGVVADLTRARLHVLTGDSGALRLAESAITATTQTRSEVARQVWLPPLAEALEARPGSDARELARTARQVAACA